MQRIKCLKKTFQELTQGPNCSLCPSNSCRESNALRRHSRTVHVERKVEVMCAEGYLFMFLLQHGLGATLLFFYHGRPPPSLHAVLASTRCVSASLRLWTNCLRLWTVLLWTVVDCCVHLWIVVDCCGPLCTLVNHSMRRRETPRDFKHSQILRESQAIERKNL